MGCKVYVVVKNPPLKNKTKIRKEFKPMKKSLLQKAASLILVLLMIVSTMVVVPFSVTAAEPDLTIGTPAELVAFKQNLINGEKYTGKIIKLTADIDMSGVEWPC